jgi:hypothetical protein
VNLGLLFLFVSSFRIAAENIRDYGLVSDVMEPPRGVTRRDATRRSPHSLARVTGDVGVELCLIV